MRNEGDAILDDILSRWHSWAEPQGRTQGHARCSAGMEQHRTSRQYDDINGALDSALEDRTSSNVDFQVAQMPEPYQTAIHVEARNLCTGRTVWGNPRLPSDPQARAVVMAEARIMVSKRLLASGVL